MRPFGRADGVSGTDSPYRNIFAKPHSLHRGDIPIWKPHSGQSERRTLNRTAIHGYIIAKITLTNAPLFMATNNRLALTASLEMPDTLNSMQNLLATTRNRNQNIIEGEPAMTRSCPAQKPPQASLLDLCTVSQSTYSGTPCILPHSNTAILALISVGLINPACKLISNTNATVASPSNLQIDLCAVCDQIDIAIPLKKKITESKRKTNRLNARSVAMSRIVWQRSLYTVLRFSNPIA